MSSTEQNYNGWSNRETWLAFLWLTNDQGNYSVFLEALKLDVPAWRKAEWLRDFLEEQLNREISGPSIWKDLLVHAFRCVSWEEIIDNNEELI
ncbi:hypothetical protein KDA23_00490 [Candidatus Saccharibacteria bacterium]|nr:hypothetical protein [Candidatus Saccharibacteria bacterium]